LPLLGAVISTGAIAAQAGSEIAANSGRWVKLTLDLTDPERQLVSLTRVHVVTEALERQMSLVIDNEIRALGYDATQVVLPLRDEYEQLWDTAISLGVDNGTFHVSEPRLAQLALLEMCNGVAHWYSAGGRLRLDQVADHFADMALALVDARMDHERITASTLRMHSANHEVETVRASFAGFRDAVPNSGNYLGALSSSHPAPGARSSGRSR